MRNAANTILLIAGLVVVTTIMWGLAHSATTDAQPPRLTVVKACGFTTLSKQAQAVERGMLLDCGIYGPPEDPVSKKNGPPYTLERKPRPIVRV